MNRHIVIELVEGRSPTLAVPKDWPDHSLAPMLAAISASPQVQSCRISSGSPCDRRWWRDGDVTEETGNDYQVKAGPIPSADPNSR